MKKIDLALKLVVNDFAEEINNYREDGWEIENWKDMLQAFGWEDSKDAKDDIFYILNKYSNETNVDLMFDDDGEMELEDGQMLSYRKFLNLVKKALFK